MVLGVIIKLSVGSIMWVSGDYKVTRQDHKVFNKDNKVDRTKNYKLEIKFIKSFLGRVTRFEDKLMKKGP